MPQTPAPTPLSQNKMFGGLQATYEHRSEACDCDMKIAVFTPAQILDNSAKNAPALIWLSGLTCDTTNFQFKAGAQRIASELGLVLIIPDTSPRGKHVPDTEDRYDFGKGAGFYLDAIETPWAKNFNMDSYISRELTAWISDNLPVDMNRLGIFGHSMGGHGALTLHLKNPKLFKSCSAFSPIVAPSQVPWGRKAFEGYLGNNEDTWRAYDATDLVMQNQTEATILIDQGTDDQFLKEHLRTDIFETACEKTGQSAIIRMQNGYDHSYFFIATFIEDHLRHHAEAL